MSKAKLRNCPHCGMQPHMNRFHEFVSIEYFQVSCNCGAHSRVFLRMRDAVASWNNEGEPVPVWKKWVGPLEAE